MIYRINTLHSYRYSWAERAREAGYPERAAQKVLGQSSSGRGSEEINETEDYHCDGTDLERRRWVAGDCAKGIAVSASLD
jgi:integrase